MRNVTRAMAGVAIAAALVLIPRLAGAAERPELHVIAPAMPAVADGR